MVSLKINNCPVQIEEGATILEAAEKAGVKIPTLCYLKGVNEIGACRACVVEVEGITRLVTSCNNTVVEGMQVSTNTQKVREARKTNVELILSQHHTNCPSCVRSGNCQLQTVANSLNLVTDRYKNEPDFTPWPENFPLIRDSSKCIKCMRCVQICEKVQGMNIWDISNTGSRTTVNVSHNRDIIDTNCTLCGQCITHCPTGALQERDDVSKLFALDGILNDKNITTVVQIAPAVRAAWGEEFGLSSETATDKRLVAALRRIGFDYIFDTNFGADLTIMEEGTEFLERLKSGSVLPMITSCCPGWIRYVKSKYPDMVPHLSTAKSPQQMLGAIIKTYFADKIHTSPDKIRCISIMPCVAKKHENKIPSINAVNEGMDVDYVLTTREICRMIKAEQMDVTKLPEEEFDSPLGTGTGAAIIFGATGGVMEAALRTCYAIVTGKNPDADAFKEVRGELGWKEATFDLPGQQLRVAVASGLGNAGRLMDAVRSGKAAYDFIEIMACPGGCAGGGGQPIHYNCELAGIRGSSLYELDAGNEIRFSHENPEIAEVYKNYLGEPNSHLAHELLHTNHLAWNLPMQKN